MIFHLRRCLTVQGLRPWRKRGLGTGRETNLSFWPVVLLKNIIIHFCGTVRHQHYGLAAHAAPTRPIKLQKARQRRRSDTNKVWRPWFSKGLMLTCGVHVTGDEQVMKVLLTSANLFFNSPSLTQPDGEPPHSKTRSNSDRNLCSFPCRLTCQNVFYG